MTSSDPTPLRIGSLCSGYGGLDIAVRSALEGPAEVAWHADPDPGAAAVLAHHWPDAPNLGDITTVDWATVPPVDVLTAGFPCQDVSVAGRERGWTTRRGGGRLMDLCPACRAGMEEAA